MDIFAPGIKINGCFIVQNISPQVKTISIFQYPINYMQNRDLLQIPGVAEQDIRASLLKGELNYKLRAKDITIVCSDIDLLQFNAGQMTFLQQAGVVDGLQVSSKNINVLWNQDVQLNGTINGVNTIFTIPGAPGMTFMENYTYHIVVYRNGVKQLYLNDYIIAESIVGNGFDTVIFSTPPTTIPSPSDVITADYFTNNSINPQ